MLVRVQGTATKIANNKHKLELDIPALYLVDATYKISVRMIMFKVSSVSDEPEHQFWSLSTTAVDKCALNPTQEIVSFFSPITYLESDNTCIVYYEPLIKREYKIQITSIHTSDFILTSTRSGDYLDIPKVEILFEISRDAGI